MHVKAQEMVKSHKVDKRDFQEPRGRLVVKLIIDLTWGWRRASQVSALVHGRWSERMRTEIQGEKSRRRTEGGSTGSPFTKPALHAPCVYFISLNVGI